MESVTKSVDMREEEEADKVRWTHVIGCGRPLNWRQPKRGGGGGEKQKFS